MTNSRTTLSQNQKSKINWVGASFLLLSPIAALVLTVWHLMAEGFIWPIWVLAAIFYFLTASAITGGYHRYFAHRSYECRSWLKWYWALFGAATFQNSILIWARDHRVHHRFVDSDKDPYSISKGFWFAHMGWMLRIPKDPVAVEPYGRDLERESVVRIQDKYYVLFAVGMGLILPMLIGGWLFDSFLGGLAVAGFLRVVAVHHGTFFINSWCHYWGRQTYTDTNTAKDSFVMAVATMGEGYHNFHHFFANDYRNGVRWYHWDPTKWMIRTFAACGLAYSLRRTPWSEIIKAQLQMDEKRLKTRFRTEWQSQFQVQLDNLKTRIESAQVRFEQLRDEYRQLRDEYRALAKNYADASIERLEEIKFQLRIARIEFKSALRQWRAYNSFLLQTCPA